MIHEQDFLRILDLSEKDRADVVSKFQLTEGAKQKIDHKKTDSILKHSGLGFKKRFLTIAALKGGIGKTFITTNVAIRASMLGAKVLIVDLDPEACATNTLISDEDSSTRHQITILEVFKDGKDFKEGIIPSRYPGLDLLPSALRISKTERTVNGKNPKSLIRKLVEDLPYDYVFFELPPSFSTLSASAYLASDLIVIPCTPNIHALESVDLTIEAVSEVAKEFECGKKNFQVLMNRYNPRRIAAQETQQLLQDDYAKILIPQKIRESAEIQNAINAGMCIFETKCNREIRNCFDDIVKILCPLSSEEQITGEYIH